MAKLFTDTVLKYLKLHQLVPRFMSNIFEVKSSCKPARSQQNLNLKVIRANQGLKI